jgi:TPR repeat protein
MRSNNSFVAVALAATSLAGVAGAATLEDGWKHYDDANFSKAAEVFRALSPIPPIALGALCQMALEKSAISDSASDLGYCQKGLDAEDLNSLVQMGKASIYGNARMGIAANPTLGVAYLAKAEIAGYPVADDALCTYLYSSKDKSDNTNSVPYCMISAASGISSGLYHLGAMRISGNGAVQDFQKGRDLFLLSASYEYTPAFVALARMAASGYLDKPKDFVGAYAWYIIAGASGRNADLLDEERGKLALNPSQVAEAQKMAASWKKRQSIQWRDLYPTSGK